MNKRNANVIDVNSYISILKNKNNGIVYNNDADLIKNIKDIEIENNIRRVINYLGLDIIKGMCISELTEINTRLDIFDYIYINVDNNKCYIIDSIGQMSNKEINMYIKILNNIYTSWVLDTLND